ncbi:MAG: radical SAM protein [Nocardioidaceae bacterium]
MPAPDTTVDQVGPWQPAAELDGGSADCGSGLLLALTSAMRSIDVGCVLLLRTEEKSVLVDLPAWARLAGHEVLSVGDKGHGAGPWRLAIMRGEPAAPAVNRGVFSTGSAAPLGSRLWLYSNFHCNLACDYCCAESSPRADPRILPLQIAEQAVDEFVAQGGQELLITGGEPFLHPDLAAMVAYGAQRAPVVILSNAMVFGKGRRRETLESMDRRRVTLQVSLDSAGPAIHDRQRGAGSHARALAGIGLAKQLGFRVRVAATLRDEDLPSVDRLHAALANLGVAEQDRLIRPIAAEGFADDGLHVSLDTVAPEPTLAVDGAWWHPVAVTNTHLKVADAPLPLSAVLDVMRDVLAVQLAGAIEGREVFRCT